MDTLTKYQNACEDLAIAFYHKYYRKEADQGECFEWVDDIGSIFGIKTHHFSPYEMLEALRLNATREQLLDWFRGNVNACCEMSKVSLAEYLKGARAHSW